MRAVGAVSVGGCRYGSDETIATPGQGFDKKRTVGGIAQSIAKPLDRGVEAVVKVDKGVRGPKSGPKLLAGDDLTRIFEQDGQDLKWLVLELDPLAVLAQFGGGEIRL